MNMTTMAFRRGSWCSPLLLILLISCATASINNGQDDLTDARNRWNSARPASYTYRYQRTCFCPVEVTRPVIVTVRNGVVDGVVYADDGQPIDPQFLEHFRTIDGLFDLLQEAISSGAHEMSVRYDPTYGYPVSAYVDYDPYIADEELRFVAEEIVPLLE